MILILDFKTPYLINLYTGSYPLIKGFLISTPKIYNSSPLLLTLSPTGFELVSFIHGILPPL